MKMKFNWKVAIFSFASSMFIAANGYIAGHTAAMSRHASYEEQEKMLLDENGCIDNKKYIVKAFKDYIKVMKDPLGFERELD